MIKRTGLSVMGYAIVLVIILAVVMIISAPMLVGEYEKDSEKQKQEEEVNNEAINQRENDYNRYMDENFVNISDEMHNIERRLSSRIDNIEMRQNELQPPSVPQHRNYSDMYMCRIEGVQNEYGNIVPITGETDISTQKIVFVCEYRR